jgi:hypothetical protein
MRKIMLVFCMLGVSFAALGDLSSLLAKFQERDAIKLDAPQGSAINFLRAVKYAPQGINKIEVPADMNIFFFSDRDGDVCKADIDQVLVRCRNEIGLPSFTFNNDPKVKFNPADPVDTPLAAEFQRREQVKFSIDQQIAISFLKKMDYKLQGITELEMIDQQTFVASDRNGNICMGDVGKAILRCKNELGITGVSFQGDSD